MSRTKANLQAELAVMRAERDEARVAVRVWKDANETAERQALEACEQNANLRKHAHDIHLAIGELQDCECSYENAKTRLMVAREVLATLDDDIGAPMTPAPLSEAARRIALKLDPTNRWNLADDGE